LLSEINAPGDTFNIISSVMPQLFPPNLPPMSAVVNNSAVPEATGVFHEGGGDSELRLDRMFLNNVRVVY
jgi:hypothetical protein